MICSRQGLHSRQGGLIKVDAIFPAGAGGDLPFNGGKSATSAASAGYFNLWSGAYRIVKPRHQTVYEYSLGSSSEGFRLPEDLSSNPIPQGHISIMKMMLDYIYIRDLDGFLLAPSEAKGQSAGRKFSSVSTCQSASTTSGSPRFVTSAKSHATPRGRASDTSPARTVINLCADLRPTGVCGTTALHLACASAPFVDTGNCPEALQFRARRPKLFNFMQDVLLWNGASATATRHPPEARLEGLDGATPRYRLV